MQQTCRTSYITAPRRRPIVINSAPETNSWYPPSRTGKCFSVRRAAWRYLACCLSLLALASCRRAVGKRRQVVNPKVVLGLKRKLLQLGCQMGDQGLTPSTQFLCAQGGLTRF